MITCIMEVHMMILSDPVTTTLYKLSVEKDRPVFDSLSVNRL